MLFDVRIRVTNLPLIAKALEMLSYWNLMDFVRPLVKKAITYVMGPMVRDLDQIEQMESPRVFKSHLPLYLLNPNILNTSKVIRPK